MTARGFQLKPAPAGQEFKYNCMILNGLEDFDNPTIVPQLERIDLPLEVETRLWTVDTIPKKGGITSSRWYTPPSPPTPHKRVIKPPSSLNPTAKPFSPGRMLHVIDMKALKTTGTNQGLTNSRWAPPGTKVSTGKTVELDPNVPVKAQDIPVHLRQYYIAPHQRPAGLQALPGKPILPFVEPHQRVGILPEVIPNDAVYQTSSSTSPCPANGNYGASKPLNSIIKGQQAVPTSAVAGSENDSTGDSKPRIPYLASTFEEFISKNDNVTSAKQDQNTSMDTPKTAIRRIIQLPSDCFSPTLAPDREKQKLQAKVQNRGKVKPGAPWPIQRTSSMSLEEEGQTAVVGQMMKDKRSELVEPKVYSTAELPLVNPRVHQTNLEFVKDVQDTILFEIVNPQPSILDLTREALVGKAGGAPKEDCSSGVSQFVSDDGIEVDHGSDHQKSVKSATTPPGDSRAHLAKRDEILQQADGSWMPVPNSWEDERSTFYGAFIPQYIATWAKTIPNITGKVDTDRDEFKSGLSPLSLFNFEEPLSQPLCYPDIQRSDNKAKQLVQTAEIDCRHFAIRLMRRQRNLERQAQIAARQQLYIQEDTFVNPNIPKIEIYLRPAQMKDIPGLTSIYNHYVLNSIIPEDQLPVSEQQIQNVLEDAHEHSLPFIVAIKGRVPPRGSTNNVEFVIGFAFTEFYNYGLGSTHKGASRFTGIFQLYVEPNHTRKGVGRSLLDRILVCSSTTHASKEGYDWISPNAGDAAVYGRPGGAHKFHQLLIRRPIEVKEDPDYEWLKQWLHSKFFIEEVARLKSVARSTNVGTRTRMLDVLMFQFEAAHEAGFDITC